MRIVLHALAILALVTSTSAQAQNFVLNGDFDTSLIGWETTGDPNMTAAWIPADADGNPQSGAIRITNLSPGPSNGVTARQCVPANSGQSYTVTGKVRIPSGAGQSLSDLARVGLRWYSGPDCTTSNGGALSSNGSPNSFNVWVNQSLTAIARPGARSVEVRVLSTKVPAGGTFIADFDDVTLTSRSIFANGFD